MNTNAKMNDNECIVINGPNEPIERMTFEEYEAFQIQERNRMMNTMNQVFCWLICIAFFILTCIAWYLVGVGKLAWYFGIIIQLILMRCGAWQIAYTIKNRV